MDLVVLQMHYAESAACRKAQGIGGRLCAEFPLGVEPPQLRQKVDVVACTTIEFADDEVIEVIKRGTWPPPPLQSTTACSLQGLELLRRHADKAQQTPVGATTYHLQLAATKSGNDCYVTPTPAPNSDA